LPLSPRVPAALKQEHKESGALGTSKEKMVMDRNMSNRMGRAGEGGQKREGKSGSPSASALQNDCRLIVVV
jgi:hypothetical protein